MRSAVAALGAELGRLVAGFEPELVTASDAAELVRGFAEVERLASAGRLLATSRMARTSAWTGGGDTDVAGWMARTTGQSTADAKRDLAAARALGELDDTRDALRQGRLTKEQVREVAPAAVVAPGTEGGLLEEAARGSVDRLAGKARAAKATARRDGRDAVAQMRRRRVLTHGRSDDGSAWLRASGPPDDIARALAGLAPWAESARRGARSRGEVLTEDQARFDGLVAMAAQPLPVDADGDGSPAGDDTGLDAEVDGAGFDGAGLDAELADARRESDVREPEHRGRGRPRWAAKVIVNVDLEALRRGFVLPGERCEITRVGEVAVAVVDDLVRREDTFVAAVLRDGVDIQQVAHVGRGPTAAQRTALEADHDTCCIDGCPNPPKVIDHHHRFADGGPRTLANLGPLCDEHDRRKTHQGWVLVRHGRTRRLFPPDHPLVAGSTPGGCLDLDHPDVDTAPRALPVARTDADPAGPTGHPSDGADDRATGHDGDVGGRTPRRGGVEQLDLLVG